MIGELSDREKGLIGHAEHLFYHQDRPRTVRDAHRLVEVERVFRSRGIDGPLVRFVYRTNRGL